MVEYGEWYVCFGCELVECGWLVWVDDYCGYGCIVKDEGLFGYFVDEDGWVCVIVDFWCVV